MVFVPLIVFVLVVVFIHCRTFRVANFEEFATAGYRLKPWQMALSYFAAGESAWLLVGLTGLAYSIGFQALWGIAGEIFWVWFSWRFVAERLRKQSKKHGALSAPDYLHLASRDQSGIVAVTCVLAVAMIYPLYLSIQFSAVAKATTIYPDSYAMMGTILLAVAFMFHGFFANLRTCVETHVAVTVFLNTIMAVLFALVVFAAIGAFALTLQILRPIELLSQHVLSRSEDDYKFDLKLKGEDELARLVQVLGSYFDKLDEFG